MSLQNRVVISLYPRLGLAIDQLFAWRKIMHRTVVTFLFLFVPLSLSFAQVSVPNWSEVEVETLEHFRALLQFDTSDPPGRELPAAEYLSLIHI